MFRELKKLERDLRILNNTAKHLKRDIENVTKEIQDLINEAKIDALSYALIDFERVMAVGSWPYKDEEEVIIKTKHGKVKYERVGHDEIYFGDTEVVIKDVKVGWTYFEDALRLLCAMAHERYHKRVYKNWGFGYYVPKEVKEAPVFIVYYNEWFVAIAPIIEVSKNENTNNR